MKHKKERVYGVVTAYQVGKPDSLVTTIPHRLRKEHGIKRGARFLVKTDAEGKIILDPLEV